MRTLTIEDWSARGLKGILPDWSDVLARSRADPLFNSPGWLEAWWEQHRNPLAAELVALAACRDSVPVGLALCAERDIPRMLRPPLRRLEILGTARGADSTVFSERSEVIVDRDFEEEAIQALAGALGERRGWDELCVSYAPRAGAAHRMFQAIQRRTGGYLREADMMEAWEVPLPESFEALLAGLGQGTRARVQGSRTRLEKAGELRERILSTDEFPIGWQSLRRFHELRWRRSFGEHWQALFDSVGRAQSDNGVPVMSVLEFDGQPISVLVCFRAGDRQYVMSSMFADVPVKRVSPGWMHLGFAMERACRDGIRWLDLLGGSGKNQQYKAAFDGRRTELVCLQLLRSPGLKLAYRARDRARDLRAHLRRNPRPES